MYNCKNEEEKIIFLKKTHKSHCKPNMDIDKIAFIEKLLNNVTNKRYLYNFLLNSKKPKPISEDEDLDDFIFKDEPIKLHSER